MIEYYTSSGLASPIQLIDFTGQCIAAGEIAETGVTAPSSLFTLDVYGNQIAIETIGDKLASIRRKSHSELGDAWSRLARM
jgi:hypothetical protein